jgi:hypothetical protein
MINVAANVINLVGVGCVTFAELEYSFLYGG